MPWTLTREYDPKIHRKGWLQLPTEAADLTVLGGDVFATVQTAAAREALVRRHGFRLAQADALAEPVAPAQPVAQVEPPSRAELLEQAKALGIKGRTKMDAAELQAAIAAASSQGA